MINNKRCRD